MIDTPQILQTVAQTTAVIHLTIPKDQIQHVMGPGIMELMGAVAAQGIVPTGRWFTHHLRMDPDTWDFEIGVPVDEPVAPAGRVRPGVLPAATVARTIYHGGYEGLSGGWGELMGWIAAQGRTPGPSLWETYLTDPSTNADSSKWQTQLTRPLAD